jgi:hypothetical protein
MHPPNPEMRRAASAKAAPNSQSNIVNSSESTHERPPSQQEARRLARMVFGCELPRRLRGTSGRTAEGIRWWRSEEAR